MRKKPYTVSEEEYKLIQRLKLFSKEDKQRTRLLSIKKNKRQIKQKQREVEFKKEQIKNKEVLEKHVDFVDGKKPMWYLQNDIEDIEAQIEELEEQSKYAQKEYDKEAKS